MNSGASNIVRFSIADNDFYFKQFLLKTLLESPFFRLVNDCNNGNELINRLYRKQEDIFLIDLYMPILSGLEAIKFIRETNTDTPIITYSATYQEDMAEMLKKIPKVYYCQKNSIVVKDVLKNCIHGNTGSYSAYLQEWSRQAEAVKDYMKRQRKSQEELSVTEVQILKLSYEGFSNKEIGERINLSTRTIDTYVNRLTDKLGLKSKLELIRYCVENGYYNTSI